MRISTQAFFERSAAGMNSLQQQLFRVQQKLASGSRFLAPSDDPVAAARALGVSQSISETEQFATSRSRAVQALSMEERALQTATTILQGAKTLVVQAGNGTMSDADRGAIATALEGQFAQLLGVANSDDGNGQYLFAGFRSDAPPFAQQADGTVQYLGDGGQRLAQVDVSRRMAVADTGTAVFGPLPDGAEVFGTLRSLITTLRTPAATPADLAGLRSALDAANVNVTELHDNLLTVRASVGSRLSELDALDSGGEWRNVIDQQYLSQLQDLDYASAISEFATRETGLKATQQTFARLQDIALFKYL